MPLICPRCRTALAAGDETCRNCGQPPTPTPAVPDAPRPAPRAGAAPWWLPALFAVGLLLALTVSALLIARRGPVRHAARPADAAPRRAGLPAVPAPTVAAASLPPPRAGPPARTAVRKPRKAVPLSVLLTSSSRRHRVGVGEDVTFIALAHGRCASLMLSYRHGLGGKTTHSFAEGGLLSTTWTPTVPGRYGFTATALGNRQSAVSRSVEIVVDAPAPQRMARALPVEEITPLPPLAVRLPPLPRPVPQSAAVRSAAVRSAAVPPLPRTVPLATAPPVVPEAVTPRPVPNTPRPAPAATYHVAAAQFPLSRSAVVLAKAFRLRGSAATTKRMVGYHGKTVYAVVTGAYRRPEEARAAVLVLQRSGYPAYLYGGN